MRHTNTICLSCGPEHVDVLDRLAALAGSRSAAIRNLLEKQKKEQEQVAMEEAYDAYFSDPKARDRDGALTEELFALASWPEDHQEKKTRARPKRKNRTTG